MNENDIASVVDKTDQLGRTDYRQDVFISYSSKNKNVADAVVADLEQHGIKCWYAPRDILPGQEWVSAICEGIRGARIFVLIFTSESNTSKQVKNEVALAYNDGLTIVPFKLTEDDMNGEFEYYLSRVHWLDAVSEPMNNNIKELREYLSAILQKKSDINVRQEPVQLVIKDKKRYLVPVLIGVVGVFLILLFIRGFGGQDVTPVVASGSNSTMAEDSEDKAEAETSEDKAEAETSLQSQLPQKGSIVEGGSINEDIEWCIDSNGILWVEGSGGIPDYEDYGKIPWYGKGEEIQGIIIGDGITSVGDNSFRDIGFDTLILADSITEIGKFAFFSWKVNVGVEEVTLPEELSSLGVYAFLGFSHLKKYDISESNKYFTTEDGVLYDKQMKKILSYPPAKEGSEFYMPNSVTDIGNYAFGDTDLLKNIRLSYELERIGMYAFARTGLESIVIPEKVKEIYGAWVFDSLGSRKTPFEVEFKGSAPNIHENAFDRSFLRITVPDTWTEEQMQQYGGSVEYVIK